MESVSLIAERWRRKVTVLSDTLTNAGVKVELPEWVLGLSWLWFG